MIKFKFQNLALITITTCARTPTLRKIPLLTVQHTAVESAEIPKSVQPSINNPYASPIVQRKRTKVLSPNANFNFYHSFTDTSGSKVVNNINPYIIGGAAAVLGQFPWHGRVITDSTILCGCSLIREDICLTAAQCIGLVRATLAEDCFCLKPNLRLTTEPATLWSWDPSRAATPQLETWLLT